MHVQRTIETVPVVLRTFWFLLRTICLHFNLLSWSLKLAIWKIILVSNVKKGLLTNQIKFAQKMPRCLESIPHKIVLQDANRFSHQIRSVAQSCPTLCDPMNRSTPGLPVHHQLPEFTQTHVHWVRDAIQPSHPLSSPSPRAPNPSQHQSLFQWVNSLHEVAKVLEFQL